MRLSILNFKSIKQLDFDLKNLTILTGLNSSGKSSVIDSIRMLNRARLGKKPFLQNQGNFDNLLCEWFEKKKIIKIDLSYQASDCSLEINEEGPIFKGNLPLELFYVGAERVGAQIYSHNFLEKTEKNDFTLLGNSLNYFNEHRFDIIEKNVLPNNEEDKALIYALEDWMQLISLTSQIDVKSYSDIDLLSLKINTRRASNVGFGVSYVFPIILSLLVTANRTNTLLIIENPEAHIHPRGQSILGELIAMVASSGTNIILETHSDHILSGIRIATKEGKIDSSNISTLFFELIEEKGQKFITSCKQIHLDKDGRFDNWPKGFFDQFDIDLERLLK